MRAFIEKHMPFVSTVYTISFYIGMFWGFIKVLQLIFDSIREGNFFGFVFVILFNSFIAMLNALLFALVWGTIALIVLFIPYLLVRGLFK